MRKGERDISIDLSLFQFVINTLEDIEFVNKYKTDKKHFTRDRVWTFKITFLFICSFMNKRLQQEVDGFFGRLFQISEEVRQVTASAFSQCRDKISFKAFEKVFEDLTICFYDNYQYKKYYGFRLLAIDGSVYTVPKTDELIKEFGSNVLSKSGKWIKAQVSFTTDVLNNICVAATIDKYKQSEQAQAETMLKKLGDKNLLIFDRGYFTMTFFRNIYMSGNQFCFRLSSIACKPLKDFIKSEQQDIISAITIDGQDYKVRFTKIQLDSGELEYLCTSLFDMRKFTISKLKQLYHLRWGVEEQFKDMKHALCVENFVGKKVNSIKQEFFGNIITYNLAMMSCKNQIEKIANKRKKKYKYKVNKRALLGKFKQCFTRFFHTIIEAKEVIINIIKVVAEESVPIREGRRFIRGETVKAKKKHYNNYVPVN